MQKSHVIDEHVDSSAATTDTIDSGKSSKVLVVINQQETLIFTSEVKGSVPEHIHPFDPNGALKHLKQTIGADAAARSLENSTYYKDIATALVDADELLLMGHGTGASSAMVHFQDFLVSHHKEIADRIVGALTVDLEAMTEGQMLQEARAFFISHPSHNR